jgi:hypothetical protein
MIERERERERPSERQPERERVSEWKNGKRSRTMKGLREGERQRDKDLRSLRACDILTMRLSRSLSLSLSLSVVIRCKDVTPAVFTTLR